MRRPSPLLQMALALVALTSALLLLAHLFFGLLPDRDGQKQQQRRALVDVMAVQVAALLQTQNTELLDVTLRSLLRRNADIQSLAVRKASGEILLQAGEHAAAWVQRADDKLDAEQMLVTLNAADRPWGRFEVQWKRDPRSLVWRWLTEPLVMTMFFISSVGLLVYALYMRRALQHLDPASVIPSRVQGAFDSLSAGVAVLDLRGRVLLANRAFRALHPAAAEIGSGAVLSHLPWLAPALPDAADQHPWMQAMASGQVRTQYTMTLTEGLAEPRQLIVGCAPVTDAGGHVRGCLTTFDDVSDLHRLNQSLQASQQEIERQNAELHRLATRDPMTGCLNRRAFLAELDRVLEGLRANDGVLSCVIMDIDHFKSVNDTHGHGIGDRVIQEAARRLQDSARGTDLVCRWGGEEFVAVVPGLGAADAVAYAERVRQRVESEVGSSVREVPGMRVTISLGVQTLPARQVQSQAQVQAMMDQADQALYQAKRGGRNRVVMYVEEAAEAADEPAVDEGAR